MLPILSPMLASSGGVPDGDGWAFEPKLDGWRVLAYADGDLDIRTRTGRSIATSIPELAPLLAALLGRSVILDGELVAGQGRPDDFYRLGPRLSASRPNALKRWSTRVPLTLAIFDILHLDGEDLTAFPYSDRRESLESLHLSGPNWCTVASYRGDGVELLASCGELDLEGIVAKRVAARYRPGARSRDWLKVKTPMWRVEHAHRRHENAHSAPRSG